VSPRPRVAGVDSPHDLLALLGGTRGVVESSVPGVLFGVVYPVSGGRLGVSVAVAVASAVVIAALALLQRRTVQQAVSGLLGVVVMAAYAEWRGDATSFYFLSVVKNAGYGTAYLVSVLLRWPLLGLILGPLLGEGVRWRRDPARLRAYSWASLVWAAMFGIRVAVQVPLYAASATTALGLANIPLGLPLFIPTCIVTWLILRSTHPVREAAAEPERAAQPAPEAVAD